MKHHLIPPIIFLAHSRAACRKPKHSEAEWTRIILACGYRCFYCSEFLSRPEMTKDHLVPLFRGGCECSGNLVLSCLRCNSMKKERTLEEFLAAKPVFAKTFGQIPTRNNLVGTTHDPLLAAISRLAVQKRMPAASITRRELLQSRKVSFLRSQS
jgi:hypothetical protein